jgi:hypothetical protein
MDDKEPESLRTIAGRRAQSWFSPTLDRIAQSLDLPTEAFYAPDQCGFIERETERLLVLVGLHLRRLDPGARTRFGDAVRAMVVSESAEDGPRTVDKARPGP